MLRIFARAHAVAPALIALAAVTLAGAPAVRAAIVPPAPTEALSRLASGPMLGYVEIQEVAVWLQTRTPARVQLRLWPAGQPDLARVSEEIATTAEHDHIARFVLPGLAFGTSYEYEVYLDGTRLPLAFPTRFETQPMWRWRTPAPTVRFAVGSCAYVNEPAYDRPGTPYGSDYEIFGSIVAQEPDFMVWLGDNVYYREADWSTEAGMRRRWSVDRALPELQPLLAAMPHYATWDDHDFGGNNSDRTFRGRDASLRVFQDYWPNPGWGTREAPGAYFSFDWSDVDVFVLDGRMYRAPGDLPPSADKAMLGREQLRWLEESLLGSRATFKFVALGSQMINPAVPVRTRLGQGGNVEGWGNYPDELAELLRFIREERIEGIVFLSGDRHRAELVRIQPEGLYPLFELTTSSLTAGVDNDAEENPAQVPGTLYFGHNFAMVEVTGAKGDRVATLVLRDAQGVDRWRHVIHQRELTFGPLPETAPSTTFEQEDIDEPEPGDDADESAADDEAEPPATP